MSPPAPSAPVPGQTTPTPPIDLSIGDPGYQPPPEVRAVAVRAIGRGLGGYAPAGGLPRLRAALAARLAAREGIPATPGQVVVTTGASLGIFATLATLCRPGHTVLLPDPGFPLYRLAAAQLGLRVASYPLSGAGEPDWTVLARLAPAARVLVWNYPSNPLGALAGPAWWDPLFGLLRRCPDLVLLSDEVYLDLCLGEGHAGPAAAAASLAGPPAGSLADRVVSVFSFSKSYGMAAWRVGYLHATAELAGRIARAHWGASMSTPTVSQLAALAALDLPESHLAQVRRQLRSNRDLAVTRLVAAGLACQPPPGGFFAWADVTGLGLDGAGFARWCASQAGVLVSPGPDFGPSGQGRIRLNYAVPVERLGTALDRLDAWLGTRTRVAAP